MQKECIFVDGPLSGRKFSRDEAIPILIVPETKNKAQWFETNEPIELKSQILYHTYEHTNTTNGLYIYSHKETETVDIIHFPFDNF